MTSNPTTLRDFLEVWTKESRLQTFSSREQFRREAEALLASLPTTPSEVAEPADLPPMPPVDPKMAIPYDAIRYVSGFTEQYVQDFARTYALAALAASQAASHSTPAEPVAEAQKMDGAA